jgi:hypothetical protein
MFCPECRKYTNEGSPTAGAPDTNESRRRIRVLKVCPTCGTLLARDRLVAEFPEAQQPKQAGRTVRDSPMTVQDVLRETASPTAIGNFGNAIPLDEQPVRPKFSWKSLIYRNGRPGMATKAETSAWGHPARKLASMDIVLGIAAAATVILLVVTITMRTSFGISRSQVASLTPPAAQAGNVLTSSNERSGLGIASMLGTQYGYSWYRTETQSGMIPIAGVGKTETMVATYTDGSHEARLSVVHFPSDADAEASFARLAGEHQFFHDATSTEPVAPQLMTAGSLTTIKYDAPTTSGDGYMLNPMPTGLSPRNHSATWRSGSDLLSVDSDTAKDRDDFLASYPNS